MKRILLFCFLAVLLCGCGKEPVQEVFFESTEPETLETPTVPETEPAPDPIQVILEGMTTEEKVGQIFLARCPEDGAEQAKAYHLGGYILFGRDFANETPDSMRQKIASYQEASDIPMLIAVDEEGGTVCRVSAGSAFRAVPFPSPRSLYEQGGMELALSIESEKAYLLKSLGINVNMAPVCDIAMNPGDFMYSRSLGQNPKITGDFVCGVLERYAEYKLGAVLKHYPGYGSNVDTHTGIAVDDRTLDQLETQDLIPFQQGNRGGCGAIMMSHNIIRALDDTYPASLSPAVHDYLRRSAFEGVIVTDELSMGAIAEQYGSAEAAVLAVLAGNDLLCTTDYKTQYEAVLNAVENGVIPGEMLDQAVCRILNWKQALGLIPVAF